MYILKQNYDKEWAAVFPLGEKCAMKSLDDFKSVHYGKLNPGLQMNTGRMARTLLDVSGKERKFLAGEYMVCDQTGN